MDLLLYLLICFSVSTALVCLSYVGGWAVMRLLRSKTNSHPHNPHQLSHRSTM